MSDAGRHSRSKAAIRVQVQAGLREPSQHGAVGYREGCSCDRCKRGHADEQADARERRSQLPMEAIPHGANGYQNYKCDCDRCREGNRVLRAESRARAKQRREQQTA